MRKVNYAVERTRVGQVTDYERLVLEVWTDGTITPAEAIRASSDILVKHFFAFSNVGKEREAGPERPTGMVSPEIYQTPIEKLQLSPRTLNCLKRAHITRVGQVLEMTNEELLKIRNFGEKSLGELLSRLKEDGMFLGESAPDGEGTAMGGTLVSEDDSLATDEDEAFWDNMEDEEEHPAAKAPKARRRDYGEGDDPNDEDDDDEDDDLDDDDDEEE